MTDEKEEIFSTHLREVKAKRKSTSFGSLVKRLKLEQEFRKILVALKENEITWQEVLPSLVYEKKVELAPDFILWKYDVKAPIFLIELKKENGYTISRDELVDYLSFLKKADYDVVVTVWMESPSFPCRVFEVVDVEKRVESKDEHFVINDVSPFKQRILDYFSKKTPIWPIVKFERMPKLQPEKLLETYESTLRETIKKEVKSRRPYLIYRKQAINDISDKDLDKMCFLTRRYLMGELSAKDVVMLLKELVEERHNI